MAGSNSILCWTYRVAYDTGGKNELTDIQNIFLHHKNALSLQSRHILLSESFEIIDSAVEQLNCGWGKVADGGHCTFI